MTMPDPTHPEVLPKVPQDSPAGQAALQVNAAFSDLHKIITDLTADAEKLKREVNGDEGVLRWLNISLADPFGETNEGRGNPLLLWLIDKCIEGLQLAGQKLAELYAKVAPFFTYVGNSRLIREHRAAWIEQVGRPLSERVGWFTPNKLTVDDAWSGPAMGAYGNTLPAQNEAVKALTDHAMNIGGSLDGLAAAIDGFWYGLMSATGDAAKNLAAISVGLLSTDAGEQAAKFMTELIDRARVCLDTLQDASEKYRNTTTQLSVELNTNVAFPSAKWPTPGEPISTSIEDWTPGKAG